MYKSKYLKSQTQLTAADIEKIIQQLKNNQLVGFYDKDLGKFISYTYEFLDSLRSYNFRQEENVSIEFLIAKYTKEEITFNKNKIIDFTKVRKMYAKRNYKKLEQEDAYAKDFLEKIRTFLKSKKVFFQDRNTDFFDVCGLIRYEIKIRREFSDDEQISLKNCLINGFLKSNGYIDKTSEVDVLKNTIIIRIW